jgi:3'-phosphoadenosine 5'-phosphosulfate sulfotransferase (PAPS reductase)/FAD synthetase
VKPVLLASFSGGRTSAVMTKRLLDEYSQQYDIKVVFANTGEEREETLEFVRQCDIQFGFGTVWIEAVTHHGKRLASTHRIVTFETASRKGEPFEEVIQKYGIPNQSYKHCTRELKLNPIRSYMESIGHKSNYVSAVGIRTDETRRIDEERAVEAKIVYPMIDWFPMDKQDVNTWWEDQPFNLNLQEHQGNCKWCWKKHFPKHFKLIAESPEIYDFPRRMEALYGLNGHNVDGTKRVFFRNHTSTDKLFEHQKLGVEPGKPVDLRQSLFDLDAGGDCAESCEMYAMEETK